MSSPAPRAAPHQAASIQKVSHELRAACMRITRRVRHEASSLPPHQVAVLSHLLEGPLNAAQIAERESVSAPSMSRTIGELEGTGLISRAVSDTDRRQRLCSLTPAGLAMIDRIRTSRDSWMVARVEAFTDDEREVLIRATALLNRMLTP